MREPRDSDACTCTRVANTRLAPILRFSCPVHGFADIPVEPSPPDDLLEPGVPVLSLDRLPDEPIKVHYVKHVDSGKKWGATHVYLELKGGQKVHAILVEDSEENRDILSLPGARLWLAERGCPGDCIDDLFLNVLGLSTDAPEAEATAVKLAYEHSLDARGPLRIYVFNSRGQIRGRQRVVRDPDPSTEDIRFERARHLVTITTGTSAELRIVNEANQIVFHVMGCVLWPPDPEEFWRTAGGPK